MHPQTTRKIVVGVDGAPRTIAALRWAASEALRRDAEIVAVHAWGSVLRPASYAPVAESTDPDESARHAAALLSAAVRTAFGAAPPVPVRELVDDRAVVPALLSQARRAELLVVATRAPDLPGGRRSTPGPGRPRCPACARPPARSWCCRPSATRSGDRARRGRAAADPGVDARRGEGWSGPDPREDA